MSPIGPIRYSPLKPETPQECFAVSPIRPFAQSQTTLAQLHDLRQVTPMRVLVVEDDEKIALFVIKGLKQNGYAVDHGVDGEQGLDFATAIDYDLVILDLMLPKLDGLSVLRRLRQEKPRTPVLILSARVNVDDRVRGLQAGSDDYLTKPFSARELLSRVSAQIDSHLRRQESEERLNLALELGKMGTWDIDLTTNVMFWSAGADPNGQLTRAALTE